MNYLYRYFQILIFLFFCNGIIANPIGFTHNSPAEAKLEALDLKQNILVYYSADWCLPCQLMEEYVLGEPSIKLKLQKNYVLINAEYDEPKDKEWFDLYDVSCLPTISIVSSAGVELDRIEGSLSVEELDHIMKKYAVNPRAINIAQSDTLKEAKTNSKASLSQLAAEILRKNKANFTPLKKENRLAPSIKTKTVVVNNKKEINPPTLIGIKEGVNEEKKSFFNGKVSKKSTVSNVPSAVDLDKLAELPSRGSHDDESEAKTVSVKNLTSLSAKENTAVVKSESTFSPEKKKVVADRPLRTPITGKIISSKRSNVGIQFGAFGSYDNALKLTSQLEKEHIATIIIEEPRGERMLFKVLKLGVQRMFEAKKDIENYNRQGIKCFLKLL